MCVGGVTRNAGVQGSLRRTDLLVLLDFLDLV